jgi:hypothetical protein
LTREGAFDMGGDGNEDFAFSFQARNALREKVR